MSENILNVEQLKALCLARSGMPLAQACRALQVVEQSVAGLNAALGSLPDDFLFALEKLSSSNAALRRAVSNFTDPSLPLPLLDTR